MTITPRLRIAKIGKSVFSSDPRDFVMDERYNMFKYHSSTATSITINGGDTEKSVSVSHTLGYVPAFIVYYRFSDENVERILPDIPYGIDMPIYPWAYATTSEVKIGISLAEPYNRDIYTANEYYDEWTGARNQYKVGNDPSFGGSRSGAVRFTNIALNNSASITSATIDIHIAYKGAGAGDVKLKTYGIDEDDTGDFGSNPMGRSKTTACESQNVAAGAGSNFGINVIDEVREITTRGGWSSGNDMGFLLTNDSNSDNVWIQDYPDCTLTKLQVQRTGTLTVYFRVIIFKDKIA
jgi:hypothetical protein